MDKMGNSMIATVLTSTPVPVPTATLRASTGWSVRTLAICSFARDFAALEEAAICAVALDAIVVLLADEWHDLAKKQLNASATAIPTEPRAPTDAMALVTVKGSAELMIIRAGMVCTPLSARTKAK
mmetsp:Transcript_1707/g.5600  ORF Transcript_1707/g.5600 Transcript_1707/m.5600 type:complete len:126 (+) Transcript_1707:65-442(+)